MDEVVLVAIDQDVVTDGLEYHGADPCGIEEVGADGDQQEERREEREECVVGEGSGALGGRR